MADVEPATNSTPGAALVVGPASFGWFFAFGAKEAAPA